VIDVTHMKMWYFCLLNSRWYRMCGKSTRNGFKTFALHQLRWQVICQSCLVHKYAYSSICKFFHQHHIIIQSLTKLDNSAVWQQNVASLHVAVNAVEAVEIFQSMESLAADDSNLIFMQWLLMNCNQQAIKNQCNNKRKLWARTNAHCNVQVLYALKDLEQNS